MIPFRVYDRENKITWTILNFHPTKDGGEYLAARSDDSNQDGQMIIITIPEIKKMRLVDFADE